jgi:pyruvate kinase
VTSGGSLGSTKGVNLPNVTLKLPSMTEKDKEDIMWAIEKNNIDIVAASFVRKGSDVRSVKAYLERCISRVNRSDQLAPIVISKIENKEGVDNFDDILKEVSERSERKTATDGYIHYTIN